METVWLFRAELRRYFAERWSHFGNFASALFYAAMVFGAIVVILSGVTGGSFDAGQQFLALCGWLAWLIASDCMSELRGLVEEEAATGTLEQLCLAPFSLLKLLVIRGLAYFLGTAAQYTVIAGMLLFFTRPAWPGPAAIPVLLISLVGAYGLGFVFAGLALVLKHTGAVFNLAASLMIFTSGALIGLEKLGAFFDVLRLVFPMTWGISLLRGTLVGKAVSGWELLGLGLHSAVYLALGLAVYLWGYRTARERGTLGHY